MDCKKCGNPMYHPSPNKLCPQCEGEALDKWIAEQDAAQQSVQADGCTCAVIELGDEPCPVHGKE
jgi:hypothetical protein